MVKGTNKRVVVVKSPDPKVFEQAIFIVRENYCPGETKNSILSEAEKIANTYFSAAVGSPGRLLRRLPGWVFAAAGALLGVILCFSVSRFLF